MRKQLQDEFKAMRLDSYQDVLKGEVKSYSLLLR